MFQLWSMSFQEFYLHVGPCPDGCNSLDRIDVNGNYEPGNVRWADPLLQAGNTRKNRLIEFGGELVCVSELARRLGVKNPTIFTWLNKGLTIENIVQKLKGVNANG